MPIPQQQHTGTPYTGTPYAQPLSLGLATPGAAGDLGEREMKEICPFCHKPTTRYEHTSDAGTRAASLCCGIPQEFLDLYDAYASLPGDLMQVAIDGRKKEYDRMDEKDIENARQFKESLARWHAKYDGTGLVKGEKPYAY